MGSTASLLTGAQRAAIIPSTREAPYQRRKWFGTVDLRDMACIVHDDLPSVLEPGKDDIRRHGREQPVLRAPDDQRWSDDVRQYLVQNPFLLVGSAKPANSLPIVAASPQP